MNFLQTVRQRLLARKEDKERQQKAKELEEQDHRIREMNAESARKNLASFDREQLEVEESKLLTQIETVTLAISDVQNRIQGYEQTLIQEPEQISISLKLAEDRMLMNNGLLEVPGSIVADLARLRILTSLVPQRKERLVSQIASLKLNEKSLKSSLKQSTAELKPIQERLEKVLEKKP